MVQKMKKSKGFTLIEMLVVIAIIAVLVSIIVPVVSNSTGKAKAATDAANLRSLKAELTIAVLNNDSLKGTSGTATNYPGGTTPVPECKTDKNSAFAWSVDAQGNVTVSYGSHTIETLSVAAGGTSSSNAATCTKSDACTATTHEDGCPKKTA